MTFYMFRVVFFGQQKATTPFIFFSIFFTSSFPHLAPICLGIYIGAASYPMVCLCPHVPINNHSFKTSQSKPSNTFLYVPFGRSIPYVTILMARPSTHISPTRKENAICSARSPRVSLNLLRLHIHISYPHVSRMRKES
jgi:hypothetical protein